MFCHYILRFILLLYIKNIIIKNKKLKNPKGGPKYDDNNDKSLKNTLAIGFIAVIIFVIISVIIFLIMTDLQLKT